MTGPRFFADEDSLGLGKALNARRGGVVYPGHPDLPEIPRQTLDDRWLPVIGEKRLIVISRDRHIRTRPVERMLWQRHRVRGFILSGRISQSTQDSLAVLDAKWTEIESLIAARKWGPWMYAVTSRHVTELDLDDAS
jgi:hypothetical protein